MKVEICKQKIESFLSIKYRNKTDLSAYQNLFRKESTKHPHFEFETSHQDEKTFVENFGNPLYSVEKKYAMVVVERTGEKVSLKLFYGYKNRMPGNLWFSISKNCDFITVNLKTGNVYQGHILDFQKKKKFKRKIRCNFFFNKPLFEFQDKLKRLTKNLNKPDDTEFYWRPIMEFVKAVDDKDNYMFSPNTRLFKFYLDKKQIKYPNNFETYQELFYGKRFRDLLKKSENKLVETVMKFFKINGDKVRKSLHEVSYLNITNYLTVKNLFGEDWVNQDDSLIKELINSPSTFDLPNHIVDRFKQLATKKEKRNAFLLFKTHITKYCVDKYTLIDHFRFFVELKGYGETQIFWKSDGESLNLFSKEHLDWTEKLDFYKKGSYQRIYPEIYFEKIHNFEYQSENYYPLILSSSEEYNDESNVQSNCVKSYIGRPSALIVSLRKGSSKSENRLTIEYKIIKYNKDENISITRIQTRAKYNSEPSEQWNEVLQILDNMMNNLAMDNNFKLFKLEKICANKVKLESETEFDECGNLKWSFSLIDYQNFSTNLFI